MSIKIEQCFAKVEIKKGISLSNSKIVDLSYGNNEPTPPIEPPVTGEFAWKANGVWG